MNRKFWEVLEDWNNNKNKQPLLVIGARQTGKSFIIEKFCNQKYKKSFIINLLKDKSLINIFNTYQDFDKRVEFLSQKYNINLKDKDTIIFVDEVQESEDFIESLKLFCEAGYTNIICAGSLLGVKLKRFKKSYPVGKVQEEILYPMDFEEFLEATGNERYIESIKNSYINNIECIFHDVIMDLFRRYLYLGGMPAVIQNYIDNNQDLSKINNNIIRDILSAYIEDMSKYNMDNKEKLRIQMIYNNIAPQLLKENPKFMYAKFDKKERKSDYVTALDWLVSSHLVLKCNQVTKPEYPVKLFSDEDNYKLFLSDVGLLRYMIGIDVSDMFFNGDYQYKGVIAENYVATEFIKQYGNLHYWSRKGNENNSKAEVDFIIQIKDKIIPVEVKAGEKIQSKSLDIYKEEFKPSIMIRISAKNFGFENGIKSIPLYACFLIKDLAL